MLHIAQIQQEFLKQARKWKDLTLEEQKRYLKKHPGSKRRVTAKPGSAKLSQKLETVRGIKRVFSRVKKLDNLSTRAENKHVDLKRNKVYWVLEKSIVDGKPPVANDPYNLSPAGYSYNEKLNKQITKRLNTLVNRITDATFTVVDAQPNRHMEKELQEGILNYIKKHYLIERKIAPPKKIEDLKKQFKSKVNKTKKVPNNIQVGHRVRLSNGVEMTVTGIQYGRKYTTILGDTDEGAHWHTKQRGSFDSYKGSNLKYLGKTSEKDKEKHVKNRRDFDRALDDEKLKRKVQGRNKVEELNIQPGNTISIRGTHYNWEAKVVSVDWKQGGVRIDQQRQRRQRPSAYLFGGGGGPVTTHYRFIPAASIVDVVKRHD